MFTLPNITIKRQKLHSKYSEVLCCVGRGKEITRLICPTVSWWLRHHSNPLHTLHFIQTAVHSSYCQDNTEIDVYQFKNICNADISDCLLREVSTNTEILLTELSDRVGPDKEAEEHLQPDHSSEPRVTDIPNSPHQHSDCRLQYEQFDPWTSRQDCCLQSDGFDIPVEDTGTFCGGSVP